MTTVPVRSLRTSRNQLTIRAAQAVFMPVWPGDAYPLGASYDGTGTNFALFSEVADRVVLCLFDQAGGERQVELPEVDGFVWHGYLPGIGAGQRYAYRVQGPHDPAAGLRCNPDKLLLDPYAKAIEGPLTWNESLFGYQWDDPEKINVVDSAPYLPKCVVINPYFDWGSDRSPCRPYHKTVIYEAHVRGLTMRHPEVPVQLRGTYAGLAHPVIIEHLLRIGVTAVELMPVQHYVDDHYLVARGQRNYWGYNTIGFFAPHAGYAAWGSVGQQVQEFKAMVKTLHEAGIEVILDVVYNHTAEGSHLGPTVSFRGVDNAAYYRLVEPDRRYYVDYTGTGNTLNAQHPHTLQLIMDSLRYWITEMHVDGFRFDLAPALARGLHEVDRLAAFFDLVQQDPVVSQVKLIAEPWDVGTGGYQVGKFPPLWSEWNDRYRDAVRDFWRDHSCTLGEFTSRFAGSSDLYEFSGRRPYASVNFITAHDGFTLHDLVSYDHKHNEHNGENNRDGSDDNRSWNCGIEGDTTEPRIISLRQRQQRNFLATLFLSQGVPMLLHGDELGRTQGGNNNAYCQDNETSWVDWQRARDFEVLTEFTARLARLRHDHPVFRRRRFFQGRPVRGTDLEDIAWLTPAGVPMTDEQWTAEQARALAIFLNGDGIPDPDRRGMRPRDDSFLLFVNPTPSTVTFAVPDKRYGSSWTAILDTAAPEVGAQPVVLPDQGDIRPHSRLDLHPNSLQLLIRHRAPTEPSPHTAGHQSAASSN